MDLSKGIDTKAKYDGQRACEIFYSYSKSQVNNNMVSGNYAPINVMPEGGDHGIGWGL